MFVRQRWLFKKKAPELTRQAKENPMWERVMLTATLVGGALGITGSMYLGRRAYFHFRGDVNVLWVEESVRDYMREHPKLAVAALHMSVYHPLLDLKTPFGAPMVAPSCLQEEAEELHAFLKTVREGQPHVSMADLWVLASGYALAGLGGPMCNLPWGNREAALEELSIIPHRNMEETMDSTALKKRLVSQGFALQELTALMGFRTIGAHWDQRNAGVEFINHPAAAKLEPTNDDGSSATSSSSVASTGGGINKKRKSAPDDAVFDNDYFINLLEHKWTSQELKVPVLEEEEQPSPDDGATTRIINKPAGKSSVSKSWFSSWKQPVESITVYTSEEPEVKGLVMRPMDMALLNDPLLKGWVVKFAENEIRFFHTFYAALERVQLSGYVSHDVGGAGEK